MNIAAGDPPPHGSPISSTMSGCCRHGSRARRRAAARRNEIPRANTGRCGQRSRAPGGSAAGKIDRRTPRRVMPIGEESRRESCQVIPLGAEMIVDDVEKDGEAAGVARLDQMLSALPAGRSGAPAHRRTRRHIPNCGRRENRRPASARPRWRRAGKNGRDGLRRRRNRRCRRTCRDAVRKGRSPPSGGRASRRRSNINCRIDDLAGAVHTLRLVPRGRVGEGRAVDDIAIARARPARAVVSANQPGLWPSVDRRVPILEP